MKVGELVSVKLDVKSGESLTFRGFMIQARDSDGNLVGEFSDLPR